MNDLIVNFCPTGMVPDKTMNPKTPLSPQEIIEETHQAYEIGITIAHLHARDASGKPTFKKEVYRDIFEGVRKFCPDLVICGSSSGRNFKTFEQRSEVLELYPDMCSLTLSSLNFLHQASVNEPDMIQRLLLKMNQFGVVPELECFDMGMINYGKYLIKKGLIKGPYYWNLLFGNIAGFQANYMQLGMAVQTIGEDQFIGLAGLGDQQLKVSGLAIFGGFGVRIGLEDNIWWDLRKEKLTDNLALLHRVHELRQLAQRPFMKPHIFGKNGFYNTKNSSSASISK
jgi:3-keto-5-aminohexanoate cleavage enzyme